MGEVYLAEDTTLDRFVALKVLPASVAADLSRRARFIREAKAVAALNHPNIVTLHSVEESGEVLFLTMEVVDGKALADLLPRQGFPLDRFFAIAIPLAGALAAAHQRGITHRDLKPSNVMVTADGRVKVLDFGIAKALTADEKEQAHHLTVTEHGVVVGTLPYMAPEQAAGQPTDARSDIFSLGVVLFEMLTGKRPFDRGVSAALGTSAAKPSPREHRPDVPRELARLVQRCLAIEPGDRYQSALDLQHGLREIQQDLESGELLSAPRATSTRRHWPMLPVALAAIVVAALAALWGLPRRASAPTATVPRLENAMQVTSSHDVESYPSWSPDGGRVTYMGTDAGYNMASSHDIWVAQVGSGEPVNLTRHSADDRMPSWSPDGREIAFFSDRDGGWAVYTIPAIGGNPRNILPLPELPRQPRSWSAPHWSSDGKQLFVAAPVDDQNVVFALSLLSLRATRSPLPQHGGNFCWDLSVSPDRQRFAYVEALGSAEVTRLWTVSAAGGEPIPLTDGRTNVWSPRWSNDGRTVYYVSNRGGSMDLWQQPVASDGTPMGDAAALTQGLGIRSIAFSPDGRKLAYGRGGPAANIWRAPLHGDRPVTWADARPLTSERAFIEFVDVSPDGTTLALSSDRRGNPDLWLLPVAGGEMTPLATDPTPDWSPRWSPDGTEIAFYSYRSGNRDIWVLPARGGPARQLTTHPGEDRYPTWSPTGRELAYWSAGQRQIMIVPAQGGEPRPLAGSGQGIPEWAPTDDRLLILWGDQLFHTTKAGGTPVGLPRTTSRPSTARFFADGKSILFSVVAGPIEDRQFWHYSLPDGRSSRITDLQGRRGSLNESFATDGKQLYFLWREDEGDIWVIDVTR